MDSTTSEIQYQKSRPILPQTLEKLQTCSLPCTEDWAGEYEFEVLIDSSAKIKKLWQYSSSLNKVFVDAFDIIPLKFKMNSLNQDELLFVRAMPVYADTKNICFPVKRCPFHVKEEEDKGLENIEHVLRCDDQSVIYDCDPVSKRCCVTVPFGCTDHGCNTITYMYSVFCKSSCTGGINRRPITIVFTLEKDKEVVGRRTLNIKVCSSPRRDKNREENLAVQVNDKGKALLQPCPTKRKRSPEDLDMPINNLPSKKMKLHELSTEENNREKDIYNIEDQDSPTSKKKNQEVESFQIVENLQYMIKCQESRPVRPQTSEKSPSNIHENDSVPSKIQDQESRTQDFETLEKLPTCLLPSIENWEGHYQFKLFVDSSTCNNETWQISYSLKKVFVKAFQTIPLHFRINFWDKDESLFVRAMPVYTDHQHMCLPVNRCLFHLKEDNDKGLKNIEHVVRCEDEFAVYDYDPDCERYSVIVPLGHPQSDCDVVTHLYTLVCKSSCCGGMNHRPIMIVFTLEKDKKIIGRRSLNIKECSIPRKDKEEEEKKTLEEFNERLLQHDPCQRVWNTRKMGEPQIVSSHTLVKSPTSSLPCTEDWGGNYQFELQVESSISNKKTWQYSSILNKVFINAFEIMPINFKTNFSDEESMFVRAMPVYVDAQFICCPVNRCPYHLKEEQNKENIEHVVRCEDQFAVYEYDPDSERYSVTVPLRRPQPGCDVVTYMYSLVCKTSCCGGMNRRPIMIIFTLEKKKKSSWQKST